MPLLYWTIGNYWVDKGTFPFIEIFWEINEVIILLEYYLFTAPCHPLLIPIRNQSVQFSSLTQSWLTHCDPMDCSLPGFPVLHQLPELAQTHVHQVSDAIQPSHPLSPPSSPAFSLSQHQGLFWWVGSSCQEDKVLEFQLHQSFQWIFRTDFL